MSDEKKEAASKKRRGRPTVYTRDLCGDQNAGDSAKAAHDSIFYDMEARARVNMHYVIAGLEIADALLGKDGARREFTAPTTGRLKGQAILEQVGRMKLQDGYSDGDCRAVLGTALHLRNSEGWTVRDIERWIRHNRTTGEW